MLCIYISGGRCHTVLVQYHFAESDELHLRYFCGAVRDLSSKIYLGKRISPETFFLWGMQQSLHNHTPTKTTKQFHCPTMLF